LRAQRPPRNAAAQEAIAKGAAGEPDAVRHSRPFQAERSPACASRARSQLQEQLARLDAKPPLVTLADSSQQLVYKKNEPFRVPLRITDDYRVAGTTAMVQSEDKPGFKPVDLTPSGSGDYVLEIPVAIHGNGKVDFYVEARDVSGHTAQLGSPQAPLHVDRKRWEMSWLAERHRGNLDCVLLRGRGAGGVVERKDAKSAKPK
jgi:hypothetical protein